MFEASDNVEVLSRSPYIKDRSILGSTLEPPFYGKPHIPAALITRDLGPECR